MLSRPPAASADWVSRRRGRRLPEAEDLRDAVVGDEVGEPVGSSQQQPVPGRRTSRSHHVEVVQAALGVAVDRAQHDVAPRVPGHVVRRQLAGVDEVLDVGVVVGDLAQPAVPEQVAARVPDVAERGTPPVGHQHGQRGGHARSVEVPLHAVPEAGRAAATPSRSTATGVAARRKASAATTYAAVAEATSPAAAPPTPSATSET